MSNIKAQALSEVEFFYDINHPVVKSGNTFKFYKIGTLGVGRSSVPILSLDDVIDKKNFDYIYEEIEQNVPKLTDSWVSMIAKGIVPTFLNNEPSLDSLMVNLIQHPNVSPAPSDIKGLVKIREHYHKAFGLQQGWRATLQLRTTTNFKNKCLPSSWKDVSSNFPLLKQFIEALPIVSLGYVNIMMYGKGKPLPIHRDTFHVKHSEHFININFHRKPKPVFLYDEILDKKQYLPEGKQCYFFNECDLHGVDGTEEDYYTVRIDCKFDPKLHEMFELSDGNIFDWNYLTGRDFLRGKKIYVEDNTSI